MECSRLHGSSEIHISNVTAIINEAHYKDSKRLFRVLKSYRTEETDLCYLVSGTCEQIDDLSVQLSAALRSTAGPDSDKSNCQQKEDSSLHRNYVSVSATVMNYIQQKCSKELHKIAGNSFSISPLVSEGSMMVLVVFTPRNPSMSRPHADFVRQRFIVFYQKTASNLKVINLHMSLNDNQKLQRKFPQLLIESSKDRPELTVMGTFAHIAMLEKSLHQKQPHTLLRPPDRGTMSASPTNSRENEDESCPICLENIPVAVTKKKTLECKHSFCTDCLKQAFDHKPICPTCGRVYGVLTGTQPKGGKMIVSQSESSLPGYDRYGTIIINYIIPSGIQEEEHPNPGEPYSGVTRRAFLPDSPEGRKVLMLLRKAFNQRLIFTVGQSTSTNRNNTVTWNDVHHKTSTHGGPTSYGYPDPDYLRRVQDELSAKGIK
ncbi:probable E3 ubiquitin-protein ligase DTX3 isoform X1 [Takifugu flavidus]|uniref:E3 ubiquitin-protein ligase n=1 Tax=Takifugu bimaculatus TaxID=433685 RepID=A0A4Z2BCM6_9TELE|nr:probable E3 ubiquitin-protein ligase DTX3 isoform X1 [Takifugu flavidus]TNM90174.1 hypothetical protein fugu_004408 [Takifugu bimaculatus]